MDKEDLGKVDDLEVEALSDEELNSVAGGVTDVSTAQSCLCCVETATTKLS